MAGPLIRPGDKTSHGGAVISVSPRSDSGVVPIARMGDSGALLIAGQQYSVDKVRA